MQRAPWVACAVLGAASWMGCSAIVQPDTSRLGGGADAGTGRDDADTPQDAAPADAARTDGGSGDVDTGPVVADAGCTGDPFCAMGALSTCEGGVRVSSPCRLGCAPGGEPRCAELVPSNVEPSLFDPGAPDVMLDGASTIDTGACAWMGSASVAMQHDGSEVCVQRVHDLRIANGASLRVIGPRPLIVLATGNVRVDGRIDASAVGVLPGAGGRRGGGSVMRDGEGESGGAGGMETAFSDGGGGGGGHGGAGGEGGNGGGANGGAGGGASGATDLIPLRGGAGGGSGPGSEVLGRMGNTGLGGAGGGALQITARGSIRVDGEILACGGGGGGGGNDGTLGAGNFGAGGGGGAGGAVLLEAPTLDVTGRISTTGGGGGGSGSTSGAGEPGTDGRDTDAGPAAGGASGGTRYGATGGASGADEVADAEAGETNPQSAANGGGGGGGVGRIVLRDVDGTFMPGGGASLSPSATGLVILPVVTR